MQLKLKKIPIPHIAWAKIHNNETFKSGTVSGNQGYYALDDNQDEPSESFTITITMTDPGGGATDLARETADMVLPEGGLNLLPWGIKLSRNVRKT